jgi:hypothetical protein
MLIDIDLGVFLSTALEAYKEWLEKGKHSKPLRDMNVIHH